MKTEVVFKRLKKGNSQNKIYFVIIIWSKKRACTNLYAFWKPGELGSSLTQVDDFTIARTDDFIKEILKVIEDELNISKVEKDNFRYTGQDISTAEDGSITIEM